MWLVFAVDVLFHAQGAGALQEDMEQSELTTIAHACGQQVQGDLNEAGNERGSLRQPSAENSGDMLGPAEQDMMDLSEDEESSPPAAHHVTREEIQSALHAAAISMQAQGKHATVSTEGDFQCLHEAHEAIEGGFQDHVQAVTELVMAIQGRACMGTALDADVGVLTR